MEDYTTKPNETPVATAGWVDVESAARRLGMKERRVQHLCAYRWAEQGLARLARPAGGGVSRWFVCIDLLRQFRPQVARRGLPGLWPSARWFFGVDVANSFTPRVPDFGRFGRWRWAEVHQSNRRRWAAYRRREGRR